MRAQRRVQDEALELGRVDRLGRRAGEVRVDVRSECDAERIVRVNPDHARLVADEAIELVRMADGDVFGRDPLEQKRLHDAQAVGHVDSLPSAATSTCDDQSTPSSMRVPGRQRRQEHLALGAPLVLARLGRARGEHDASRGGAHRLPPSGAPAGERGRAAAGARLGFRRPAYSGQDPRQVCAHQHHDGTSASTGRGWRMP